MKNRSKNKIIISYEGIKFNLKNVPDKKYYNWVALNYKEKNTPNFKVPGFPYFLKIEPTNICNLDVHYA